MVISTILNTSPEEQLSVFDDLILRRDDSEKAMMVVTWAGLFDELNCKWRILNSYIFVFHQVSFGMLVFVGL